MSTAAMPVYEWKDLPWKDFERQVFKLQKRIYQASRRDDRKTLHRLQRLLLRSWAARCVAVRRVTQDNRGKRTAGVDGVKNLTPQQRLDLARSLTVTGKAHPIRRIWLPKPGTAEKRALGIPTVQDRAAQTLVRLALEPEWEARFEPGSYGFRPGRSCHDAIQRLFIGLCHKPKYVLDADIAACFDRINRTALVRKLHTFPTLRRAIRGWLDAGVLDGTELFPTEEGVPQGAPLSPVLANISLHGLETTIRAAFPSKHRGIAPWQPLVLRYADDFVVLHEDRGVIERVEQIAADWLAGIGLELKASKTRIVHTLDAENGPPGFDFLGFTVRQYPVGKTHVTRWGRKKWETTHLAFKTLITPSRTAQQRHLKSLAEEVHRHRQAPQQVLIACLNRKIGGWANYYSTEVSKAVFTRLDHLLYRKLKRWAERRHPTKSHAWVRDYYWHTRGNRHWVFGAKEGQTLLLHSDTPIRRHSLVKGTASLFDGDIVYWAQRLGRHPELPKSKAQLLKRQQGRCAWCGLVFMHLDELMESDHIVPKTLGGSDRRENRQLLHGHCHDVKTARDGSYHPPSEVPMSGAKSNTVEERYEGKPSRAVL
jgi:RNA-directed DNA polymerase